MEEKSKLESILERSAAFMQHMKEFLKTHPPSRIEAELNEYIIDQPSLTENVADFLYYQALRRLYSELPARPMMICGPSGSGKTEVWRAANKLYGEFFNIQFVNAAMITSDGWSGSVKLASYLSPNASNSILVLDEADKMFLPRFSVGGVNVSENLQSELLKIIEENPYPMKTKNNIEYAVENLGVVFVGAFEGIRKEKTQPVKQEIGFGSKKPEHQNYSGINRDDLLQYGVLPELLGRIAVICNTNPITKEQTLSIVRKSKSRVTAIADLLKGNGIDPWKDLTDEAIMKIIETSDIGKYGVRDVLSRIETVMLSGIHKHGLLGMTELCCMKNDCDICLE